MVLVQGAQQALSSGSLLGGAMAGASAGAMFGPIGAGVGAVAGGLLGFFGGKSKEKKQLEDMRKQFIEAAGGLEVLREKAKQAGVSIDKMLAARKVKDFESAIKDLNGALEFQAQAEEELQAAIEKYGFTIQELGPKFKQQKLDEMAAQLVKEYNILIASGIDVMKVTEKMGPALNDYVKTAMEAGVAIPESMRPALQKLLEMGQLTDAAGNKLTSLEGITFTEALTESMSRAVDQMVLLVEAIRRLAGMPPINIPINVPTNLPNIPGIGTNAPHMPHLGNFASGIDMIVPRTGTATVHAGERLTVTPPGQVSGGAPMIMRYAPVINVDARGMSPDEARRAVRSAMDGSDLRAYGHFQRALRGIRN
jgi:hypothetical protein